VQDIPFEDETGRPSVTLCYGFKYFSTLLRHTLLQPFEHGPILKYMNGTASTNGALNLSDIQNRHVSVCIRKGTHSKPIPVFVSIWHKLIFTPKVIAFTLVL
jgi:hypothetical protein